MTAAPKSPSRILVATDFSEPAEAALEHAVRVAEAFGAAIILAHVVEPVVYPVAYGVPPVAPVQYEQVAREGAEKALGEQAEALVARGVEASVRVDSGHAPSRLCELAEEVGADLIVVGTHGRTGLRHLLLGSTAEHILRHAKMPVLSVRAG